MCLYVRRCQPAQQGYVAAGDLLRVLAAPARLAIVVELANEPLQVNELVERLELSQPLVSQHLRVLRGARLVAVERRGRRRRTRWSTSTSPTSSPTPFNTVRKRAVTTRAARHEEVTPA